jgi:hypothetical protein
VIVRYFPGRVVTNSRVLGDDAVEGRCALGEHVSDVELHLLQGLGEKGR